VSNAGAIAAIVPVRDGASYIAEALASILEQSCPPAEVIVVDDGSDDDTPEILESLGPAIRIARQAKRGYAAAVNRGIDMSTTELLGFLDADDLWPERSLEVRLGRIGDESVDAVCGRLEQFVSPELQGEKVARFRFDPRPRHTELLTTMLIRRRALERVGPLDERLATGANIDWVSRARACGVVIAHVDDTVCRRRLHRTNTGLRQAATEREELPGIVRAHRRRMGGPGPDRDS
jgi:glycosyltransferase involved in cell wall biosynthesis